LKIPELDNFPILFFKLWNESILVIFHGNCHDGLVATLTIWLELKDYSNCTFCHANSVENLLKLPTAMAYPKDVLLTITKPIKMI
jgi:hypothetical protein